MNSINDMVFTSSGCLSPSGIEDFAHNILPENLQEKAKQHIKNCDLCREAVEGYLIWTSGRITLKEQSVSYKPVVAGKLFSAEETPFRHKIEDINNRVKNRVKVHTEEQNLHRGKKKVMPIGWMAMAASVILLVGLFYRSFFYPSIKEKTVTENIVQKNKNLSSENQPTVTIVADTVKQIAVVTANRKKPEQTVDIVEDNIVITDPALSEADGSTAVMEEEVANNGNAAYKNAEAELPAPAVADEKADKPSGEIVPENPFAAKVQPAAVADAKLEKKSAESIRSGRSQADVTYVDGIKVTGAEVEDREEIFLVVEQMPEYPGGDDAYKLFLQNNIRYPQSAKENGIEGTVYLSFEVNKKGKIRNVTVLRGVDVDIDSEAVRVVKMMPDWIPGIQRGKPVDVNITLPIKFSLK